MLSSWTGEMSVKERFAIAANKVVQYMEGTYTLEQAEKDMKEADEKRNAPAKTGMAEHVFVYIERHHDLLFTVG